jgi:hypothetical protein
MTFEKIVAFLNTSIISIENQPITMGDILLIPLLLIIGVY